MSEQVKGNMLPIAVSLVFIIIGSIILITTNFTLLIESFVVIGFGLGLIVFTLKKEAYEDTRWYASFKDFWTEYRRHRIGIVGLISLSFFIIMAATAPWIMTHDPDPALRASADFQAPQWMSVFDPEGVVTREYLPNTNLSETPDITVAGTSPEFSGFHHTATGPSDSNYVNLTWTHTPNTSIAFRQFPDVTGDMPDTEDYVYVSQTMDWPYETMPEDANVSIDFGVDLTGDFTGEDGGFMFKVHVWLIDSSNDFTRLYSSVPPYSSRVYTRVFDISYFHKKDAFGGMVEDENGDQEDPEDKLKVAIGIAPTLNFREFYGEEPWRDYEGSITLTVKGMSLVAFGKYFGYLGTTNRGADAWSQLVYGARVSLYIGILATGLSTAIGLVVGMTAGYLGGKTDEVLMRINDFLLVIPGLPLMMILAAFLERGVNTIILVIALVGWSGTARLIRSQVLVEKNKAYVESARAIGASDTYIMFRHVLPNVTPILFANITLGVTGAILSEAALSFLGLTDPAEPSWGRMLSDAQGGAAFFEGAWWVVLVPGMMITALSLSFTFIGHTLDQVLNPRLRQR